ncbi:MAG: hypothetical protein J2P46_12370 [Zavarzinella sp.]|nr:hypothetical protein [Zavarzinella sp.]
MSGPEIVMGFWRDSSGRLTFDLPGVAAADYPAVCRDLENALGLTPAADLVVGLDQLSWDFRRGDQVVGLDWDNWMQFMAVARSEASEPLVRDIAAWLGSSQWSEASNSSESGTAAANPPANDGLPRVSFSRPGG